VESFIGNTGLQIFIDITTGYRRMQQRSVTRPATNGKKDLYFKEMVRFGIPSALHCNRQWESLALGRPPLDVEKGLSAQDDQC